MDYGNKTIAIPPGNTIREQLETRKMKQKEFALRMGLSEKHISRLINGQVELTREVALRLESVLGVPASFWNNLESIYRENKIRVKAEQELNRDIEIAAKFPYSKMVKLGWISATGKAEQKVHNLRLFFEVAKLDLLGGLHIPGITYRKTGMNESSDYSLAAWSQKARLEARELEIAPINIKKLHHKIPKIREMTVKNPEIFCKELTVLLAKCGIALVFLPHIGGSFLHGASFFDRKYIVMGLTVRGKYADKFWFSLFHELCHIVKGHINDIDKNLEKNEEEADEFSQEILIHPKEYEIFINENCFTKVSILAFANKIGIAPGIIVGRLQKENYIPYNRYNEFKVKYQISC